MTRLCLDCSARYFPGDPYRCRPCYLQRQRARNNQPRREALYGGLHYAHSRAARRRQPWCSICGRTQWEVQLTWDHEHGQVECVSCNSSHRSNPA